VEVPSTAKVTNDPNDHGPVDHGADDVIDCLVDVNDLHGLAANGYLEPVLIKVNRPKNTSKRLFGEACGLGRLPCRRPAPRG
jgi:hypothetical protein